MDKMVVISNISSCIVLFSFYLLSMAYSMASNNGGCLSVFSKNCEKYGFNITSYPNYLGQMSVEMADQTLAAVLDQITYCSIKRSHAELIACAIHVPLCVNGQRVPPCNEDCLDVINTCKVHELPGLKMAPIICGIFPNRASGNCIAIPT